MDDELWTLPATTLRELIAARSVSPVEVVRAAVERAERLQPALNCFITLRPDEALAEARAAEAALQRGEAIGPLHGLPFSCKDIVNTAGVRTTFGSLLHADNVPSQDAVAVARLKAAGAILIGKTTTSEFGAKCLTDAPLFGRTPNAWDRTRTSGGSSGGAAVAVAAGITALGVATDGGGSTRIPAACNGVVGIKQSLGLVPHSQVEDVFGNLTYVTPMTRTVDDTVLMLQVLAGEDPCDPWSAGVPAGLAMPATAATAGRERPLQVGWCASPGGQPLAADVRAAYEAVLRRFEAMGAHLHEVPATGFDTEPVWRAINHTVWRTRFGELARQHGDRLTPSLLRQLELARDVSGIDYQQAMFARTRLFRHVQQQLAPLDVLVTPTLMRTALPIDQDLFGRIEIDGQDYPDVRGHWFPWTMPFNLTGHPALSLPCAFGRDGLPIGVQLVGHFRRDGALLQIARELETALGLTARRPTVE